MRLWREPDSPYGDESVSSRGEDPVCQDGDEPASPCGEQLSLADNGAADWCAARAVCDHLGIRHHLMDLREVFFRQVVSHFIREYARGRTPNPCLRCNRLLKFGFLYQRARELGCGFLATGHYARIVRADGEWRLLCGIDLQKDQSYFLYSLREEQLRTLLLPLGDWAKDQARDLARAWSLPSAERAESQDVCFLRDGDYRRFLRARIPEAVRPGPILDAQGRYLGEHRGLPFYTVGQREGLGVAAPRPLYVMSLDVPGNALVVGFDEELRRNALVAEEMSYVSGQPLPVGCAVEARTRYRGRRVPARVWALAEQGGVCRAGRRWPPAARRARIVFARALRDISPGQAVVLYRGEQLLGGGIISHAIVGDIPDT